MKFSLFARLSRLLPLLILPVLLTACGRDKRFTIIGNFTNMPAQKVRLQELRIDDKTVVVDSGRTNADGKFELSAESAEPGPLPAYFRAGALTSSFRRTSATSAFPATGSR